MPIDHVSLPVSSVSTSRDFYLAALKPLSYQTFMAPETDCFVGLNSKYAGPDFWIHKFPEGTENKEPLKTHVAFRAKSQRQVRDFYEAALKAGATDNGKPGERPEYVKGYYAAYILDPDGHNVECVYFQPLWLSAMQIGPSVAGAALVAGVAWWFGKSGWAF